MCAVDDLKEVLRIHDENERHHGLFFTNAEQIKAELGRDLFDMLLLCCKLRLAISDELFGGLLPEGNLSPESKARSTTKVIAQMRVASRFQAHFELDLLEMRVRLYDRPYGEDANPPVRSLVHALPSFAFL